MPYKNNDYVPLFYVLPKIVINTETKLLVIGSGISSNS